MSTLKKCHDVTKMKEQWAPAKDYGYLDYGTGGTNFLLITLVSHLENINIFI